MDQTFPGVNRKVYYCIVYLVDNCWGPLLQAVQDFVYQTSCTELNIGVSTCNDHRTKTREKSSAICNDSDQHGASTCNNDWRKLKFRSCVKITVARFGRNDHARTWKNNVIFVEYKVSSWIWRMIELASFRNQSVLWKVGSNLLALHLSHLLIPFQKILMFCSVLREASVEPKLDQLSTTNFWPALPPPPPQPPKKLISWPKMHPSKKQVYISKRVVVKQDFGWLLCF